MASYRAYIRHPPESVLPDIAGWVAEVRAVLASEARSIEWDVESGEYTPGGVFSVQSLADKVRNVPGPVLLIEPVQTPAREQLRERLRSLVPVLVEVVECSEDLRRHLDEAQRRHLAFRPMLPRRFVVAVLIVRKLECDDYWADNANGYMCVDELVKGRGVENDTAADVANDLLIKGLLIRRSSKGKARYALNPDRMEVIRRIAACRTIRDFLEDDELLLRLKQSLVKDNVEVEAGLLDPAEGESADL